MTPEEFRAQEQAVFLARKHDGKNPTTSTRKNATRDLPGLRGGGTVSRPMMSSLTDDWGTPAEFFAGLDHEFRFTLDVAASASNAKCDRYFSIEDDGLTQPWAPATCWMNPPYGRAIPAWVAKAWHESTLGATVVGLLPARTDTAWWHDYVLKAGELRFVRGRLRFYGIAKDAPFPSAIAIWRPA